MENVEKLIDKFTLVQNSEFYRNKSNKNWLGIYCLERKGKSFFWNVDKKIMNEILVQKLQDWQITKFSNYFESKPNQSEL